MSKKKRYARYVALYLNRIQINETFEVNLCKVYQKTKENLVTFFGVISPFFVRVFFSLTHA